MFTKLYNMFKSAYNMFSNDYYKNLPSRDIYIKKEIEKYKIDLYSQNSNLVYIPDRVINNKKKELSIQYDNIKNFKL